jgi:probable F420-dependent oxidoreductase
MVTAIVRPFRFALQGREFADRDALVAMAKQAEALGYEELYSYDHVGAVDPFVPLVVAAEATTRLRVGPLVLNNEFHHPALLARTAATVDRLTGGRLVLGMGTGYTQSEHDAIGLLLREPAPRVDRFEESVIAIRGLLDTGEAHVDGAHHHLDIDDLGVDPAQDHVPILIGGHGRRVVGIAGRHADIFQFTGLTHGDGGQPSPGGFAIDQVRQRAAWLAEAAGDRVNRIERSTLVQLTHVGQGADEELAKTVERFDVSADLIEQTPFLLIGSLEQIVDKLERLRDDVGISHVVVRDAEGFAPVVAALAGR